MLAQEALFTPDIVGVFTSECSVVNNPIYIQHRGGGMAVLQCDEFPGRLAESAVVECFHVCIGAASMFSVRR